VKEPRWADWSPDSDRSEYFGQLEAILKLAKASLTREGLTPVVRAIVWMQGENEAAMGGAVAQAYEANLREWAAAARVRWGDANTKLIIGKIFKVWGKTPADYQAVVSAQLALSESTPNTVFISREPSPDYGHFLPEQTIQFGQDIFDAYTGRTTRK
jgi:carbohydrate esterase-like sialic acid-specific acetylesterase